MGEPTLVVRHGDLAALEAAMTKAAADVVTGSVAARDQARQLLSGWVAGSDSRQAQLAFDDRLGRDIDDVAQQLVTLAKALATVRESAHEAEVRNVAILD